MGKLMRVSIFLEQGTSDCSDEHSQYNINVLSPFYVVSHLAMEARAAMLITYYYN